MVEPGEILIDCTATNSWLRDQLLPGAVDRDANTFRIRLEYALIVTFVYGRPNDCNEHYKYYKNLGNSQYKFIPAVNRTYSDDGASHVTGIVNISPEVYARMPSRHGSKVE